MTYNEFMKQFDEYKQLRIKLSLQEYRTDAEAAAASGLSTSFISRLRTGKIKRLSQANSDKLLTLIGEDLYDSEIKSAKELEIEYLEKRLKALKEEKTDVVKVEKGGANEN